MFALSLFIQRSALCYLNALLLHTSLQPTLYSQHWSAHQSALVEFWAILQSAHQVIGVFLGGEQGHQGKASPREKEEGPQGGPTAA